MSHVKPEKITKIFDLPTECLIEIFKYLDYGDLYNLRQLHVALDDAIEYVVRNRKFIFTIPSFDEDGDFSRSSLKSRISFNCLPRKSNI